MSNKKKEVKKTRTFTLPKVMTTAEGKDFRKLWEQSALDRLQYIQVRLKRAEFPKHFFNNINAPQWGFRAVIECYSTEKVYNDLLKSFEPEGFFGKRGYVASSGEGFIIEP